MTERSITIRLTGRKVKLLDEWVDKGWHLKKAVGWLLEAGNEELEDFKQLWDKKAAFGSEGVEIVEVVNPRIPLRSIVHGTIEGGTLTPVDIVGTLEDYLACETIAHVRLTPASRRRLTAAGWADKETWDFMATEIFEA